MGADFPAQHRVIERKVVLRRRLYPFFFSSSAWDCSAPSLCQRLTPCHDSRARFGIPCFFLSYPARPCFFCLPVFSPQDWHQVSTKEKHQATQWVRGTSSGNVGWYFKGQTCLCGFCLKAMSFGPKIIMCVMTINNKQYPKIYAVSSSLLSCHYESSSIQMISMS